MNKESRTRASIILYEAGVPVKAIAEAFEVSISTVTANIPAGSIGGSKDPARRFHDQLALFMALYPAKVYALRVPRARAWPTAIGGAIVDDETGDWLWKYLHTLVDMSGTIAMLQGSYRTLCIQSAAMFPESANTDILDRIWGMPGRMVAAAAAKDADEGVWEKKECIGFVDDIFIANKELIAESVSAHDLSARILKDFVSDMLSPDFQNAFSALWNGEAVLQELLAGLPERERDIVVRSCGLGTEQESLEALGEHYDLSRERVRQIKEKGIQRMRSRFKQTKLQFPIRGR